MFLKVSHARARVYSWAREYFCIYSWASEGKGRRKERENVRACSAHQGRTRAAKSYRMTERSDAYAPEARGAKRKKSRERRRRDLLDCEKEGG